MEGIMEDFEEQEEQIRRRRQERIERMRREKQKQQKIRRAMVKLGIPAVLAAAAVVIAAFGLGGHGKRNPVPPPDVGREGQTQEAVAADEGQTQEAVAADDKQAQEADLRSRGNTRSKSMDGKVYSAEASTATVTLGADLVSKNAILIDTGTGNILARKGADQRISPASMTKVLTVLVAAERVTNLEDTFTITTGITDYSYVNDCSNVGFAKDETVTVQDLFYGTVLPSGADAAAGLAVYTAGSLEAFVELMNDKIRELGLSDTAHFTNCVGLYDENHYCTVYDMAIIMEAAMDNELCREILSARKYTTSGTPEHPEGISISNWFLRRIEDKDAGGEVLCGKTGYVVQSENCAVSYAQDASKNGYVCVTVGATSAWRCIYDHVDIYQQFLE